MVRYSDIVPIMENTESLTVNVGDRFEDVDPRSGNRVIRITERATLSRPHRYVVEVAELNPKTVGRKGHIKTRTLQNHYRRISRG